MQRLLHSMVEIFPLEVRLNAISGIVSIIKENGGSAALSTIANDSKSDIGRLFPIIEAGKILKLFTVNDGIVSITKLANNKNTKEFRDALRDNLIKAEPFNSLLGHLKKTHSLSTTDMFDFLLKRGFIAQINRSLDITAFRRELVGILIRMEICTYNQKKDLWRPV